MCRLVANPFISVSYFGMLLVIFTGMIRLGKAKKETELSFLTYLTLNQILICSNENGFYIFLKFHFYKIYN